MILSHIKGEEPDLYDYTPRETDLAANCFLKYLAWEKQHDINTELAEEQLVSEMYRFGGTVDLYGVVDGVQTLIDFKTGANIYWEGWLQLAGYGLLLAERGNSVDQRILLNIGRDETENFIEAKRTGPSPEDEVLVFRCCMDIYNAKKRLKQD
jgi:hypothetical protein